LRQRLRTRAALSLALLATVVLAACAADGMLEGPSLATTSASSASSSASAFGGSSNAAEAEPFDPFKDTSTTTDVGRREIIKDPTIAEVMLTGPLPEMSWGKPDAPVTVIKYASLTCPFCRRFQREVYPKLKRNYIDTGRIRYIVREFPIGRTSGNATVALRCVGRDKYLSLYTKFLQQQAAWVSQDVRLDKIRKVASQVGLSRAKFDACLENQAMIDGLKWVKDRGRTLGVIGTPNFFIQGKLVKTYLSYEDLARRIDAATANPVASASATATR